MPWPAQRGADRRPAARAPRTPLRSPAAGLLAAVALAGALRADVTQLPSSWGPGWAGIAPTRVLRLAHDPSETDVENGERLRQAIAALVPGDRLEIGAGTWSVKKLFNVSLQGTPQAPIWIVGAPGARPVITRPDAFQNVMNVGMLNQGPTDFVCFRGLEITGGSIGLRLDACSDVWVDQCLIHHTAQAGLAANTRDTAFLYITRNEISHTAGTGEGMYLGANHGAAVMRHSIVARNHVHHTGGWQGDGIEVKQGSYGNWIVENVVHDTLYPCLLVYGTDGKEPNTVAGNVLYRAVDNVLQVQGEAFVYDNLMMSGLNGFHSHDHQGLTRDLVFAHNTIVNEKRGANLTSWKNRPGMVFANNAVYSRDADAVVFGGASSAGVTVSGNVRFGKVIGASTGFVAGNGLGDFESVEWDATRRRAQPAPGSALLGPADPVFAASRDLYYAHRGPSPAVGAFEPLSYGLHYGAGLAGLGGIEPRVGVGSSRAVGNGAFEVALSHARPNRAALLALGLEPAEAPAAGWTVWNDAQFLFAETTDALGTASRALPVPDDPGLAGAPFFVQWAVVDEDAPGGLAFSDGLALEVAEP